MSLIDEHLNKMKANGLSEKTIRYQESILRQLEKKYNPRKITKKELIEYFSTLKKESAESTFALSQIVIRKFFMDIGKKKLVDWIEIKKPKETLKSDDILTTDEVNKMIQNTDSHYYKALIAFLFESGARFGEIQLLKYKDFTETDGGMIINIPTVKTSAGFRKMILPYSSQYIRNLKVYVAGKDDDKVFYLQNCQTNTMLKTIAAKAGIKKPITPHKFRHAQATNMVQLGYNEAIIRKKLGWSATSTMIARYEHLNDDEVINATLQNQGKLPVTAVRTELKEANKLSLVDAASQFSKLSADLEAAKSQVADLLSMKKEWEEVQVLLKEKLGIETRKTSAKRELEEIFVADTK